MTSIIQRRSFIKAMVVGAAALPLAVQTARRATGADAPPVLDVNDPTAKALAYVADASSVDVRNYPKYQPGQKCSNCSLWQGEPTDKLGGCELVLGQYVLSTGWCKAWEAKSANG
jgi:hypothetical protein